MVITHKISIDLARQERHAPIATVQSDCGRALALKLHTGGIPWLVPAGVCALVRYRKADGTCGEYDTLPDGTCAWSAEGNLLTVMLVPQMLTAVGKVQLTVTLTDGANVISTFCLELEVHRELCTGTAKSQDYWNLQPFLTAPCAALPGQYLRVLQVDGSGRVTALEPVDAPQALRSELDTIGRRIISGEISSIVLLGDSITDGAGGSDYNGSFTGEISTNTNGYCWANALKKFLSERYGTLVENKGMYGTVMAVQKDAATQYLTKKDFVIWLTGTNDRWDSSTYKNALPEAVKQLQECCAGVLVLSGIPSTEADEAEKPATMQQMDEIIMGTLSEEIPCFSMYQAMTALCEQEEIALESCFSDHVHPNDLGYFLMFTALCRKLGLPLDPYTDYRYSGQWWGGSADDSGESGDDTGSGDSGNDSGDGDILLLDSTDDYGQTPTDFVFLLEDVVPVVLMDSYDADAQTTAVSGKHITRMVLDVREAGNITFGTVDLNTLGSAAPAFTQTATIAAATTGFVEFTLNMDVGEHETLAFQRLDDTGHLGFVCMSGDLFIWQSKDFLAGAKSTDLILYGKLYTK